MNTDVQVSTEVEHSSDPSQPENFAFVMNIGHLRDEPSFTIIPGHELRRATSEEISLIKDMIDTLTPGPHRCSDYLWECRWPSGGGQRDSPPASEWRYFVIAFRGTNDTVEGLGKAFDLASLELELAFTIHHITVRGNTGRGLFWHPARLFHQLETSLANPSFFHDVSASDIKEVQTIHSQLVHHDHQIIDLKHLLAQFGQLKGFPAGSPLRFLGYFALLESLLTHPPKPEDRYDSITRQVKKKLTLLNRRCSPSIDYSPFGETPPEAIWKKMYSYRSSLAHGGNPVFTGDLAALKTPNTALALLKNTVKAVLRQALVEPQLLLDLREC